jgi:DNA-binding protein YbaB
MNASRVPQGRTGSDQADPDSGEQEAIPGRSGGSFTGSGASADGTVKVAIGEDGFADRVDIDPRVLRAGSEALAERIRDAIRAAQKDWFQKLAQARSDEDVAAAAREKHLQDRFDEINAIYAQRMQELHAMFDRLSR